MNVIPNITIASKAFDKLPSYPQKSPKCKVSNQFARENSILLNMTARSFSSKIPVGSIGDTTTFAYGQYCLIRCNFCYCYEFKLIYVLIVLRGNWVKTDLSVKQCSPIRW